MYAIMINLDVSWLEQKYPKNNYQDIHWNIRKFMEENGFKQEGNIYFGNEDINAVTCVTVVQKLAKKFPWFSVCVKDVRMLRIEENNDLMPAIQLV